MAAPAASPPQQQPLQPAELSTLIPLSSFWESHFLCPICLGEIQQCVILRGCSHQFCRSCVGEALNRRHACPLCMRDADPAAGDMQPNPAFDQLAATIRQAQRVAAAKMTKKLLPHAGTAAAAGAAAAGGGGGVAAGVDADDDPGGVGSALPSSNPAFVRAPSSQQQALSPMENLFRTHVAARMLLPWEAAYQELQQEARQTEERAAAAVAASSAGSAGMSDVSPSAAPGGLAVPAARDDDAAASADELKEQAAFFPRATHALVSAYETFLLQQPAPAFLEPVHITVTLEPSVPPAVAASAGAGASAAAAAAAAPSGGGASAPAPTTMQLRFNMHAYDDFGRLLDRVVAESRAPDAPHGRAWALRAIRLEAAQPFAASAFAVGRNNVAEFLLSVSSGSSSHHNAGQQPVATSLEVSPALRARSFASLNIVGGSHVSLRIVGGGDKTLQFLSPPASAASSASSAPRSRCFMHTYRAGDDSQRVDYYKCAPCGLNWLCAACAECCHSGPGHALTPFIRGHKPTYAACYCNKKRQCTLKE